jgi:hypothetical protein
MMTMIRIIPALPFRDNKIVEIVVIIGLKKQEKVTIVIHYWRFIPGLGFCGRLGFHSVIF